MDIKCPGCGEYNRFDCGYVDCAKCKTQLSGNRYNKEVGMIGSAIGLGVLAAAVHFADDVFSPRRYPIAKEYALVSQCINGNQGLVYEYELREITATCTCAVEKAASITPISYLLNKPKEFASRMRDAIPECLSKSG